MFTYDATENRETGQAMGMPPVVTSRVALSDSSAHNMGIDLLLEEAPSTV
jgi:hypothetical protein